MSRVLFNKSSCVTALILLATGSIACAASKDARPSPTGDVPPPEGTQVALAAPASTTPSTVPSTVPAVSSTAASVSGKTNGAGKDSTAKDPPITVPTIKGRTKKDSLALVSAVKAGLTNNAWPVKTAPQLPQAILPAHRIVAFYGNPLSKKMGILGELPPDQMLARFDKEIAAWQKADPSHPVQPALHLIAVVAQGFPGRDGKYRLRMTDSLINTVYAWAQKKNAILFLDVQVEIGRAHV